MNRKTEHTAILSCIVLYAVLLMLVPSCTVEEPAFRYLESPVEVRLMLPAGGLETKAGGESAIKTVRIYAYPSGIPEAEPVGYYYSGTGLMSGSYCSLLVYAAGDLDFYVIANEESVFPVPVFTPYTGKDEIEGLVFSRTIRTGGDLYYPLINVAADDGSNRKYNIAEKVNIIEVNLTRPVGRVRFRMKKTGSGEAIITGAVLHNGAESAKLVSDELTYGTGASPETEIIGSSNPVILSGTETVFGETPVLANEYGSGDLKGTIPASNTDKAYKLTVNYSVSGSSYSKDIWLPPVARNESINIIGNLTASGLDFSLTVNPWNVDESILDYSTAYTGIMSPVLCKLTGIPDNPAIAVASSSDGIRRPAQFYFEMDTPEGGLWMAHLSSTVDFVLEGTTSGYGGGAPANFRIRSLNPYNAARPAEAKLYITMYSPFGNNGAESGKLPINPESDDGSRKFPGTDTEVTIRQVSEGEYDIITEKVR